MNTPYTNEFIKSLCYLFYVAGKSEGYETALCDIECNSKEAFEMGVQHGIERAPAELETAFMSGYDMGIKDVAQWQYEASAPSYEAMTEHEEAQPISLEDVDHYEKLVALIKGDIR